MSKVVVKVFKERSFIVNLVLHLLVTISEDLRMNNVYTLTSRLTEELWLSLAQITEL